MLEENARTIGRKTWRGRRLAAIAAGVSLALASLPGEAFASVAVWEGFATNTAATPQCGTGPGVLPGVARVSIFRTKTSNSGLNTFLSFVSLRSAVTFENMSESTVPHMNGSGNYQAFEINGGALFATYAGTYSLMVNPATITASTQTVTITGTINNLSNILGCNLSFQGVYVLRPALLPNEGNN